MVETSCETLDGGSPRCTSTIVADATARTPAQTPFRDYTPIPTPPDAKDVRLLTPVQQVWVGMPIYFMPFDAGEWQIAAFLPFSVVAYAHASDDLARMEVHELQTLWFPKLKHLIYPFVLKPKEGSPDLCESTPPAMPDGMNAAKPWRRDRTKRPWEK